MRHRFDNLERTLRAEAQGKTIYYVANFGNWGDGLIRSGTLKFFAERGIGVIERPYEYLKKPYWLKLPPWLRKVDKKNSVLVFGGGGAWCEFWDISDDIRQMAKYFSATIVLPSTLQVDCSDVPAIFFCRDDGPSQQANPDAIFCDDMAFCLGPATAAQEPVNKEGYFFRTDPESVTTGELPAHNRDVSEEADHMCGPEQFFAALEPYEVIQTDRLHVAIASALLGREVHFYPGGYFKNYSVFCASLKENFPNVRFHEEAFSARSRSCSN